MELSYSKQLGIGYYTLAFIAILLYSIEKISIFPIVVGLSVLALFFLIKALLSIISKNEMSLMNSLIYFGVAAQISFQIVLLFGHDYRYVFLNSSLIVCIAVFILIYKFSKSKSLIPLNIVASIITSWIYFM